MKRARWRLLVACLGIIAAAFAVSGGSAGNRKGVPDLQVVPGPAAVTYGENIAYTATFFNDTGSMFTQVKFVMAPPSVTGTGDLATPVRTSCGADAFDPVTKVLTCNFGQLPPGETNKLTVTVVWKAPEGASKQGCATCFVATGTWFIKEGKETNGNETFALTREAALLGVNDDPKLSARNRAGGYELKGCAAGEANLATAGVIPDKTNPVISSFCLPASFQPASAAGGVASTITEPSEDDPNFARQSLICIAAPGQNCPDGLPATFGDEFIVFTFKVADAALPSGYKITQVFHNDPTAALPNCAPVDSDNTDPNGCVVSIDPPKGPGPKTWKIVTKAKTNGPFTW